MSFFQENVWYRLININYMDNCTLSSGVGRNTNGTLEINDLGTYSSSENWQFYFQDGRYFLRNRDYLNEWQLGFNGSRPTPQLMPIAEDATQQWLLDKRDDETFIIKNEGMGDNMIFGLAIQNPIPQMTTNSDLAAWLIDPNLSAGDVPEEMLQPVRVVEVTSTLSVSSLVPTSSSTSGSATTTTDSSSSAQDADQQLSSTSNSSGGLSAGAIAGIAIGAVAILVLVGLFLFWRRSRKWNRAPPPAPLPVKEKDRQPGSDSSIASPPPPFLYTQNVVQEKPGSSSHPGELESPINGHATQSPVELPAESRGPR